MKTAAVVVIVAVYGGVTIAVGVYVGWHKRASADRWQLEDADKVISQAIEDRQTARNQLAAMIAERLRIEFAYKYTADIDNEYRRLIDEDS